MSDKMGLVLQSFLIGFTAAATLGPIALVCIQRTLRYGWRVGIASGMGVALADGSYGLVGALGLNVLTQLLLEYQRILGFAGGVVLIFMGIRSFGSSVGMDIQEGVSEYKTKNFLGWFGSIFLLTLSNPVTIMFFTAVYAGLMVGGSSLMRSDSGGAGVFSMGVFAGSLSWWVILVTIVSAIRQRFQVHQLLWLNRVSGLAIAAFGFWVVIKLIVS